MTARRRRAAAALAAIALLLWAGGCGRKAKPEPRTGSLPPPAHYSMLAR